MELFGHAILSFEKFPGHAFANDRPFASASRSFGTNFISRSEMTPSMVIRSSSVGWIRLDTVWVDRSSDHIISATKGRITCKDVVERPLPCVIENRCSCTLDFLSAGRNRFRAAYGYDDNARRFGGGPFSSARFASDCPCDDEQDGSPACPSMIAMTARSIGSLILIQTVLRRFRRC